MGVATTAEQVRNLVSFLHIAREGVGMSAFDVAFIHEQGVEFAVVSVRSGVVDRVGRRDEVTAALEREFSRPVVLIAPDGRTYGRKDLVRWLEGVYLEQLPWRRVAAA